MIGLRSLIWKLRYAREIRKLLCVPRRVCWQMAGSTVESLKGDLEDCTPRQAAEEERDEWLACS